jgi:hypothetical protein
MSLATFSARRVDVAVLVTACARIAAVSKTAWLFRPTVQQRSKSFCRTERN